MTPPAANPQADLLDPSRRTWAGAATTQPLR